MNMKDYSFIGGIVSAFIFGVGVSGSFMQRPVLQGPLPPTEEQLKPVYARDQTIRREIFKTCLATVPAGPMSTKYNDWDEVVEACESSAYYQSLVCVKQCGNSEFIERKKEDNNG